MVVFARVVEAGGFARAGRLLGLSTSAVSRNVSSLEAHVGGRLLNRTTRSLSVTELGGEVYARCARIAETAREVASLAGHYAAAPQGVLRVTAPVVVGQVLIAPLIPGFLARYPDVDVDLVLTDQFLDIVEEGIDVAIRLPIKKDLAAGLVARPLTGTTMVLVATPAYLQAAGAPARPEQLAAHPILCPGGLEAPRELLFIRDSQEVRVVRASRMTANNVLALLDAVETGFGIGVMPEPVVRRAMAAGRLRRLLPDWTLAGDLRTGLLHVVYAPTRHLPKKVRAFIDYLLAETPNAAPAANP
jgi:DNA-binding transcriptional LysR family regulator